MESLIRKNIRSLKPYSTARDDFKGDDISVWLDANESPYPTGANRYPDPHQKALKAAVAPMFGVAADSLFIGGAGSDEAIDLTYRIFCEPHADNAVAIAPSYGVYKVAAEINDVEYREVLLNDDFSLPVDRLLAATDSHTKLIWICSPNNPTGNSFPREDILALARSVHAIVVVDEAYGDFSTRGSMIAEIPAQPNLIVLRTFSKAWGMAALRCGMAFGDSRIISYYDRIKYPYNMSSMVQNEVLARLATDIGGRVAETVAERGRLARELSTAPCVKEVFPSDANFILVRVADAGTLYTYLIDNGVIVRNRSSMPMCDNTLRITIGTPDENSRVIQLVRSYPLL